jgi:FkbM family methyltransferase
MKNLVKWFSPRKLRKSIESLINTSACTETGFLFQKVGSYRVYLRKRSDYLSIKSLDKLCLNYYYQHYLPKTKDTVVCVGSGLGHEAMWLANKSDGIRYIGIEIQPYVYELQCNTFEQKNGFDACGSAINDSNDNYFLTSSANYTAVAADAKGYIEVGSIKWIDFLSKYNVSKIDLLQINIEGAEKYLLPMITNYSNIKRIIISAHDFRADRGEGEQFRTREFVKNFLISAGYSVIHCGNKARQLDWMFAERV